MKDPLFLIFGAISLIFIFLLMVKALGKWKFCVLCGSIGLSWLALLIVYWLNIFHNPLIIALLVGNSVVGIYYLVERKIAEKFHLFRLPFFLTLLFVGYWLISWPSIFAVDQLLPTGALLLVLWLIFCWVFLSRHNAKLKSFVSQIINCCKNW